MTSQQNQQDPSDNDNVKKDQSVAACPGCDLLLVVPVIPDGHYLACGRCGTAISRRYHNSLDRVLVLSFSGLLLYLPAMLLPLMTLSSIGLKESGNVIDTCINFFRNGYYFVALLVLFTAIIFPFLKLFLPCSIALCLKLDKHPSPLKPAFKLLKHLDEWGMVEVYLLGILITLIKMGGMASIDYDPGFFCFIILVLLTMATTVCLDHKLFWFRIDHTEHPALTAKLSLLKSTIEGNPNHAITATQSGVMCCHDCGQLVLQEHAEPGSDAVCPRCHSTVHFRKIASITRTWALIITALILFIPANTLPIMRVDFLGIPDRSTILDGILYFFKEGSYGIGVIILAASVLVPLFKIIGMIIILLTIRSGKDSFLKQKTGMFRFINFIGRWSMLDIFVIALLTVMVNFGFLTSIHTAPAATYFCIVVVCTMVGANVFDPRIMWDRCSSPVVITPSNKE